MMDESVPDNAEATTSMTTTAHTTASTTRPITPRDVTEIGGMTTIVPPTSTPTTTPSFTSLTIQDEEDVLSGSREFDEGQQEYGDLFEVRGGGGGAGRGRGELLEDVALDEELQVLHEERHRRFTSFRGLLATGMFGVIYVMFVMREMCDVSLV
eukprot:TRINITY_DN6002_c0_g1_i3.p2 TRINITY_DN6002_c0_g1~~TRINITY_DN6002_c0_g1_i3.p2  ORF type:complete len:154 (-),score=39.51 TRINITY_DN6002_c0_g1_i3:30-491(-)